MDRGISFRQYLNIKLFYLNRAIRFLKNSTIDKLKENGFESKREAQDMLAWQLQERKNVNKMIGYENLLSQRFREIDKKEGEK